MMSDRIGFLLFSANHTFGVVVVNRRSGSAPDGSVGFGRENQSWLIPIPIYLRDQG